MDRILLSPGQIPAVEDPLEIQRFTMIALGRLARAVFGDSPSVDGLEVLPTTPASMSVTVNPGVITAASVIDGNAFGTLAPDLNPLVKLAISTSVQSFTLVTPTGLGQSVNYLVCAAYVEADDGPIVAPFYNAANPSQGWSGPGGGGAATNRYRRQRAQLQVIAGAPGPAGSQATPAPPAGWLPLAVVTVNAGQVAVTSASIAQSPACPTIHYRLTQLTPGLSRIATYPNPGVYGFVVPNGTFRARVRLVGGGGGGGGCDGSTAGGGGGAGGYAETYIDLNPGDVIPVVVGGGGSAGNPGASGGGGGTSSFANLISATGGAPGSTGGGGTGGVGYANQAANGSLILYGGNGGDAAAPNTRGGDGGVSAFGGGGRAAVGGGQPANGRAIGSGGGGGYGAACYGGLGQNGCVIVEF